MSKATERLLDVFEIIAAHGPISLSNLASQSGIPRSAVHRAAQVLQQRGWVRARLNDHAYEVSSHFDMRMANGHIASAEVELITPVLNSIAERGTFHADLGLFIRAGEFETVESTERSVQIGTRHSMVASSLAITAQFALSPTALVRHLDAFAKDAKEFEKRVVTSGAHQRNVESLRAKGPFAFAGLSLLPFESAEGAVGCVQIRPKNRNRPHSAWLQSITSNSIQRMEACGLTLPFKKVPTKLQAVG